VSFPKYPKYKDSGVEWLGEVPEHWETRRLGYFFNERREKVSDKDFEPLSVTMNGIVPRIETAAKTDDGENRKLVRVGDFVINSRSDRKGSGGVSPMDGSVSLISTVLMPLENVVGSFVHHMLRSVDFQEEFYRYGKGIVADLWSTNYSEMRNIVLAMPPTEEQALVAAFLDRETSKIDALVAEQRRLIELLKEKRQAVISHAVTKGLNPDAPMKPSGIEWLGDVPEHWELVSAKRVCNVFVPQRNKPELNHDGNGVCWVTMDQMRCEEISATGVWVSDTAASDAGTRPLKAGAVIASCVGTFGIAAINLVDVVINQQLQAFIPGRRINPHFLRHCVINSAPYFEQIGTAATITYVNQLGFENMPLPLPPLREQAEIVDALGRHAKTLDTLTSEAELAIELLQERRTALISAAVTGKIDVRTFAPQIPEVA
jgi:type I restriction enzyme S subunit